MTQYNAGEIFQFAIKIEEMGEKFYKDMAVKFNDEKFKEFFIALAEEEVKHKETFEKMLSEFEDYIPPDNFPQEYFDYIQAYADKTLFGKERLNEEISNITNPVNAIDFAIKREWDSISYYSEIKNSVPEEQRDLINKIINEERKHFEKLAAGRKMFS